MKPKAEVTRQLIFRVRRPDGTIRILEAHSFPAIQNGLNQVVGIISDATERLEHEQRLKQSLALQNHVLDILAHKFRTPLTAIRWNLEMMTNPEFGSLNEAQRGFSRMTHLMTIEIIERLDDLLLLMSINENRVAFDFQPTNLEGIVAEMIGSFEESFKRKSQTVVFTPPNQALPLLNLDEKRLRKTIGRLIDNAIAYTKNDGHIEIRLKQVGDRVHFEIQDDGIGIPDTEQGRIFSLFFRASNASHQQPDASGIGLYIAKYMVEAHHGTIGFDSKQGKGSTFWFQLPLK